MIQLKKDNFNIVVLKIRNVGYLETVVFTKRLVILRQQKYLMTTMTMCMFGFTFRENKIDSRGLESDMFGCCWLKLIMFLELILLETKICSFWF